MKRPNSGQLEARVKHQSYELRAKIYSVLTSRQPWLSGHFTKACFGPDSTRSFVWSIGHIFCENSQEPASTVEPYPIPLGEDLARSPQSSEGFSTWLKTVADHLFEAIQDDNRADQKTKIRRVQFGTISKNNPWWNVRISYTFNTNTRRYMIEQIGRKMNRREDGKREQTSTTEQQNNNVYINDKRLVSLRKNFCSWQLRRCTHQKERYKGRHSRNDT